MQPGKFIFTLIIFVMAVSACSLPDRTPVAVIEPSVLPPTGTPVLVESATLPAATETTASLPSVVPDSTATPLPTSLPTEIPASASSSGGGACTNRADFVADISIPDGSSLLPDTNFVKTWRIKNTGTCTWDGRYQLVYVDGSLFLNVDHTGLPGAVAPGQNLDLSLSMTSPTYPGNYESDWKLRAPSGVMFGVGKKDSPLWAKFVVASPETTSISGSVYQDRNGNGIYDGEDVFMANRKIWLQQGGCEPGKTHLSEAVSSSSGRYTLSGNFSGTLCLGLVGENGVDDVVTVNVATNQHLTGIDLHAAVPAAMISGRVWNDSLQPDGIVQDSEPFIAGVVVVAQRGPCGSPLSVPVSAITDSDGRYFFNDLYGGTYCISINANEGNNVSIFQSGNWTNPAGGSQQLLLQPGNTGAANFGWQYR